ncbi:hypothetical protein [Rhodococcus koreensis]|uniref:hypothetical protein n=1 Tax=Rhodococcus koreensis TaxID=99653 RepID=UPI0036735D62
MRRDIKHVPEIISVTCRNWHRMILRTSKSVCPADTAAWTAGPGRGYTLEDNARGVTPIEDALRPQPQTIALNEDSVFRLVHVGDAVSSRSTHLVDEAIVQR